MKSWKLEDFDIGRRLGEGAMGTVYHANHKGSDKDLAIKIIPKSKIHKQELKSLRREIEIQSRLFHENIVQLFGYFQTETCLYIILEYMSGGDLFNYIQKHSPIPLKTAKSVVFSISKALLHLKKFKIMHRDLKPENILLDSLNNPKIGDFGSCALEPNKEKRYSYAGTLSFMPPEMAEMKGYDCSCDL